MIPASFELLPSNTPLDRHPCREFHFVLYFYKHTLLQAAQTSGNFSFLWGGQGVWKNCLLYTGPTDGNGDCDQWELPGVLLSTDNKKKELTPPKRQLSCSKEQLVRRNKKKVFLATKCRWPREIDWTSKPPDGWHSISDSITEIRRGTDDAVGLDGQ